MQSQNVNNSQWNVWKLIGRGMRKCSILEKIAGKRIKILSKLSSKMSKVQKFILLPPDHASSTPQTFHK